MRHEKKPKITGAGRTQTGLVIIVLVIFLLAVPVTAGTRPVVDLVGTPASGPADLKVQFKGLSTGIPTGWAWYFGDETYRSPWTPVNKSLGTPANKTFFTLVATPDSKIVLMGGCNHSAGGNACFINNETWVSADYGKTWSLRNASPGWSARYKHSTMALPDGSIVLLGGFDGNRLLNDVWVSKDNGRFWTRTSANANWSPRDSPGSVVLPDGSIVLTGGNYNTPVNNLNDSWRSTDKGKTWTRLNSNCNWTSRFGHTMVVLSDGGIVLMGGYRYPEGYLNDTWYSKDAGKTWWLMNESSGWAARNYPVGIAMPDNSIILTGGNAAGGPSYNDTWRSVDLGKTWTLVNISSGYPTDNLWYRGIGMPDSSIFVVADGYWYDSPNQIWRFDPAGSYIQNPVHIYHVPGKYQVALQVSIKDDNFNSTRKQGYIKVT
ncbi:MAG: hypothetical protein LUQ35_05770 [Methanoregula sp.]|nr:hypothetical protein [Methanoregula sp.]